MEHSRFNLLTRREAPLHRRSFRLKSARFLAFLIALLCFTAATGEAYAASFPYTGKRFGRAYICVQNNIGTLWNIDGADDYFESGVKTVILNDRFPAWGDQPCSANYVSAQIIVVGTYNDGSADCYEYSWKDDGQKYTQQVVIGMNVSSASAHCRDTVQHRNNNISTALGNALGLANFYDSKNWQASIMNEKFSNTYNFAGSDDRNALFNLYCC